MPRVGSLSLRFLKTYGLKLRMYLSMRCRYESHSFVDLFSGLSNAIAFYFESDLLIGRTMLFKDFKQVT